MVRKGRACILIPGSRPQQAYEATQTELTRAHSLNPAGSSARTSPSSAEKASVPCLLENQYDRNTFEILENYWLTTWRRALAHQLSGDQIGSGESILKTSLRVDGGRDDANQANGE
jgi:hypothetical protein